MGTHQHDFDEMRSGQYKRQDGDRGGKVDSRPLIGLLHHGSRRHPRHWEALCSTHV